MDLPSEARQLFCCCERNAVTVPALRVGRHYQCGFWQRVLNPSFLAGGSWANIMAVDHFEVRTSRRTNPMSTEPPDWRFRLRVMSSCGVAINYSVRCICGHERDLHQSETLTVGAISGGSAGSG